jgi:chromosome segregation ATPase
MTHLDTPIAQMQAQMINDAVVIAGLNATILGKSETIAGLSDAAKKLHEQVLHRDEMLAIRDEEARTQRRVIRDLVAQRGTTQADRDLAQNDCRLAANTTAGLKKEVAELVTLCAELTANRDKFRHECHDWQAERSGLIANRTGLISQLRESQETASHLQRQLYGARAQLVATPIPAPQGDAVELRLFAIERDLRAMFGRAMQTDARMSAFEKAYTAKD